MVRFSIRRKVESEPRNPGEIKIPIPSEEVKSEANTDTSSETEPKGFAAAFAAHQGLGKTQEGEGKDQPEVPKETQQFIPRRGPGRNGMGRNPTRPYMETYPVPQYGPRTPQPRRRPRPGPQRIMRKPRNRHRELRSRGTSEGKLQYSSHYGRNAQQLSYEQKVSALYKALF